MGFTSFQLITFPVFYFMTMIFLSVTTGTAAQTAIDKMGAPYPSPPSDWVAGGYNYTTHTWNATITRTGGFIDFVGTLDDAVTVDVFGDLVSPPELAIINMVMGVMLGIGVIWNFKDTFVKLLDAITPFT